MPSVPPIALFIAGGTTSVLLLIALWHLCLSTLSDSRKKSIKTRISVIIFLAFGIANIIVHYLQINMFDNKKIKLISHILWFITMISLSFMGYYTIRVPTLTPSENCFVLSLNRLWIFVTVIHTLYILLCMILLIITNRMFFEDIYFFGFYLYLIVGSVILLFISFKLKMKIIQSINHMTSTNQSHFEDYVYKDDDIRNNDNCEGNKPRDQYHKHPKRKFGTNINIASPTSSNNKYFKQNPNKNNSKHSKKNSQHVIDPLLQLVKLSKAKYKINIAIVLIFNLMVLCGYSFYNRVVSFDINNHTKCINNTSPNIFELMNVNCKYRLSIGPFTEFNVFVINYIILSILYITSIGHHWKNNKSGNIFSGSGSGSGEDRTSNNNYLHGLITKSFIKIGIYSGSTDGNTISQKRSSLSIHRSRQTDTKPHYSPYYTEPIPIVCIDNAPVPTREHNKNETMIIKIHEDDHINQVFVPTVASLNSSNYTTTGLKSGKSMSIATHFKATTTELTNILSEELGSAGFSIDSSRGTMKQHGGGKSCVSYTNVNDNELSINHLKTSLDNLNDNGNVLNKKGGTKPRRLNRNEIEKRKRRFNNKKSIEFIKAAIPVFDASDQSSLSYSPTSSASPNLNKYLSASASGSVANSHTVTTANSSDSARLEYMISDLLDTMSLDSMDSTPLTTVVFEFSNTLCTQVDKLHNKMLPFIKSSDLITKQMFFGGEERINLIKRFLDEINQFTNNSLQYFIFADEQTKMIQQLLRDVDLLRYFINKNIDNSLNISANIIGWDHQISRESDSKKHLILLEILQSLNIDNDQLLYISADDNIIDHLNDIKVCKTYGVETKGLTDIDLDTIQQMHF